MDAFVVTQIFLSFVKITFQQFKVMIKYWRFRKKEQFGRMEEQNQ